MRRTPEQERSRLWRNRAKSLNDRARMYQADGHLHPADLREIVRRDGSRCVYCNRPLDFQTRGNGGNDDVSFDHVIRLTDGGSNTPENVVCACRTCNQKNNAKSITDPEDAALERLRWFLARKPGRVLSVTALEAAHLRDKAARQKLGPTPDDPLLARVAELERLLKRARWKAYYYRLQRDKWRADARGWRFQCKGTR